LLKLAIEAQLPMVEVTTRDTLNFPDVIKFVTGKKLLSWDKGPANIAEGGLYYVMCKKGFEPNEALYEKLTLTQATLLMVNPLKPNDLAFKAGEVPVPKKMLRDFIDSVVEDEAKAQELLSALGGCTIKEAVEAIRLTMARDHGLVPPGVTRTRKECFQGAQGLTQVDTAQILYVPTDELLEWVLQEKQTFLAGDEPRLIPRGLLMDGFPGVGKTSAAKWIANQFGVPLYRIDIGSTMEKYVGSSEANLLSVLTQLDNEEPCIALFDEIEKMFAQHGGEGDAGTSTRMLSQVLWWLAEHRSRVLVIMTTNDRKKLPLELYRDGRVDKVMFFPGLEIGEATKLANAVLATFKGAADKVSDTVLLKTLKMLFANKHLPTNPPTVSHATVEKAVYDLVKAALAK
jgi:hypothetical protein